MFLTSQGRNLKYKTSHFLLQLRQGWEVRGPDLRCIQNKISSAWQGAERCVWRRTRGRGWFLGFRAELLGRQTTYWGKGHGLAAREFGLRRVWTGSRDVKGTPGFTGTNIRSEVSAGDENRGVVAYAAFEATGFAEVENTGRGGREAGGCALMPDWPALLL